MSKKRKINQFSNLRDKALPGEEQQYPLNKKDEKISSSDAKTYRAPSRIGKKAITGFFSQELSKAMRLTAIENGISLQTAMEESFQDWLRKMGKSPL